VGSRVIRFITHHQHARNYRNRSATHEPSLASKANKKATPALFARRGLIAFNEISFIF